MAEACPAYSLVAHSSSVDGVAGLVRHRDRTLAKEVSVTSVDASTFVLVWVKLWRGCQLRDSAHCHSSADALGHAHDGVVDIARSRSW
jgi:hypothetical protein